MSLSKKIWMEQSVNFFVSINSRNVAASTSANTFSRFSICLNRISGPNFHKLIGFSHQKFQSVTRSIFTRGHDLLIAHFLLCIRKKNIFVASFSSLFERFFSKFRLANNYNFASFCLFNNRYWMNVQSFSSVDLQCSRKHVCKY